jgi:putative transposase
LAFCASTRRGRRPPIWRRKQGVSEATLYNWKAKFGGMDVSEARRLRQLEDENAKLKKLLAEQMLDAAALRELLSKKW